MQWEKSGPLQMKRDATLRFKVLEPDGSPAPLEPYIGMRGHAVVRRADGGVFAHLHPIGTISMGAQEVFLKREDQRAPKAAKLTPDQVEPVQRLLGLPHSSSETNMVSFPYESPSAGNYRLWVQVKTGGRVLTGVFDAEVSEAR